MHIFHFTKLLLHCWFVVCTTLCYIYSCTRSLRFQVLLSLWALGKSGTSTLSPNSFLPAVRAEYLIFGFCSTFCLHYFSVNECTENHFLYSLLCVCVRWAGENLDAHWGYSVSGLQSRWRQLYIQSGQIAQSPWHRGRCPCFRWWTK